MKTFLIIIGIIAAVIALNAYGEAHPIPVQTYEEHRLSTATPYNCRTENGDNKITCDLEYPPEGYNL